MKKYAIIVTLMTSIASARCGLVNELIDAWDYKVNAARQSFDIVVDFGRKMFQEEDKTKNTKLRTADKIAYTVNNVATSLSNDIESVFEGVKIKTVSMYNNMKGYLKKNVKETPSLLRSDRIKHEILTSNTTIFKGEEIHNLTKDFADKIQNPIKEKKQKTSQGTSNPKRENYLWEDQPDVQGEKEEMFLLQHTLKSENNVIGHSTLRKSDVTSTLFHQNSSNAHSDKVENTILKSNLKFKNNETEHSRLKNTLIPLWKINPNLQDVKVKDSLLLDASSLINDLRRDAAPKNNSNIKKYDIATMQLRNISGPEMIETENVSLQNMTNDPTVVKSVQKLIGKLFEDFTVNKKRANDSTIPIFKETDALADENYGKITNTSKSNKKIFISVIGVELKR
ncbi:unnamed protein product [Arctia plantaginis]|uniref:Uncharacterized protein n=1 Tax=Arctia plantaginis TaxID=874455 RepID=A0A8S1A0M7_ARCPL|nr:unnamed protein product [Arctia plantaginis]